VGVSIRSSIFFWERTVFRGVKLISTSTVILGVHYSYIEWYEGCGSTSWIVEEWRDECLFTAMLNHDELIISVREGSCLLADRLTQGSNHE
jgi:hypothetical protein